MDNIYMNTEIDGRYYTNNLNLLYYSEYNNSDTILNISESLIYH